MSIISATKMNKSFGVNPVLTDISFTINKEDRIGIVGANGAGKSTLIKILLGEIPFDEGSLSISAGVTTGYLKQRDHFPGNKTVEEEMLAIFSWQQEAEQEIARLSNTISTLSSQGKTFEDHLSKYDSLIVEFSNRRGYSYRSEIRGILNSLAFSEDYLSKKVSVLAEIKEDDKTEVDKLKTKLKPDQCIVKVKANSKIEIWNKSDWNDVLNKGRENMFLLLFQN
ncbi:MAG: ABC-F family ATP-binding cassette domain-containing protein [Candidatus Moranbacteria bacterium]|nr:ABC-F family ATP-binding cassette domain-containing protein [Candidatus Moranbacteria bacterium]